MSDSFQEQAHTALAHLYDHTYLQGHPLAQAIGDGGPAESRGRLLRRLLLDSIQELKPPPETPASSPAWHNYQYLYMRYVEARPVAEIATDLSVGERQTRRRHRDALEALSTVLLARWSAACSSAEQDGQVRAGSSSAPLLDAELRWIEAAQTRESVYIRQIVDGTLDTIGSLAQMHRVEIRSSCPVEPILVVGDRVVLRQVILGILTCAIQLGDGGRIDISTSLDDTHLCLIVGICRAPSSVAVDVDELRGHLAEVGRLLETQKGRLGIQTTEAELVIQMELPAALPTTLLIDDNPDMLQLYRRYLGGGAYRVVEAESGDEAMRLAKELGLDGIVLDVMMPSRDGWETLQLLRSHPATHDVPVVICSVLRQRELALSLGASGFLTKPVTQQALLEAVRRCVVR